MKGEGRFSPSSWLAYAVIALAPLPFGSVDTFWICIWCMAFAVSLAFADVSTIGAGQLLWLVVPVLAFAALVGVVAIQQQPAWPGFTTERFWHMAADVDPSIVPLNAATRDPSWRALGPSLLFFLVFTRVFLLAQSRRTAERIMWVVAGSAVAYACFGLISTAIDPNMLLWRPKRAYIDSVTGTFVNRNTAATYFGSAAILWLLFLLRGVRRTFGSGAPFPALARELFMAGLPLPMIRDVLGLGLCFAVTLGTGSRAGAFVTIVALIVATSLWAGRMPIRKWLLGACGLAVLIGGFVQVWGGSLTSRIGSRGLYDLSRAEAYTAVLSMIRDFPWFGVGLGQFEFAFPAYRASMTVSAGVWDKAHSVPLELAAEVGVPVTVLVSFAWLSVAVGLLWGLRRMSTGRLFPIAGMSVGLIGTAHSLVDFSLQIPGYAVPFAAITAAGLAQAVRPLAQHTGDSKRNITSR